MGLCNAPATVKYIMNRIFYDFIDDFLVVYMDDLLGSVRMSLNISNISRRFFLASLSTSCMCHRRNAIS